LAQKPCLVVRSRHPDPLAPPSTPALRPVRAPPPFYHNLGQGTSRDRSTGQRGYPLRTPGRAERVVNCRSLLRSEEAGNGEAEVRDRREVQSVGPPIID